MDDKNSENGLENKDYQPKDGASGLPNAPTAKEEKEMEKVREKLKSLKKYILGKHKSIGAIGIIPPQAAERFDEENELSEEDKKQKYMHLLVVLPDDKEKEFDAVKLDIVKKIKEEKQKIWLNIFLEKDLWEICMDSKYEVIEAIGMAFPLFDKGILSALRVAQIHKSLVLRKFEKYVYSYVIGGSLVRGEAVKTSDVDVYIIIDDTDVKRMPRLELKERLRSIIYSYIMQANELAGVKNPLNVQVYLLTEFWDGVKDANPVFFTFIRDGVPLYDRGGFLPWKLLLRMGKIKPSPESIDMFMSYGDKTQEVVKRKLLDIVMGDIYWSVITPSQAMLMLYGLPPTNIPETVREFKRIFVDKEKIIEQKYADILDEIVIKYYKGYEHEKIKEVSGADVDRLLKNTDDFLKRLKELRTDIEKKIQKKNFAEIYDNVFRIMTSLFGSKSEEELIQDFEKELVDKGKVTPKFLHTLNLLIQMKKKGNDRVEKKADKKKAGKEEKKDNSIFEFENIRKESVYLIESLVEYGQRKDLGLIEKSKLMLYFKDNKMGELFLIRPIFLVYGNKIFKIANTLEESNNEEFSNALKENRDRKVSLDNKVLEHIKKEFGEFTIGL